jgi:hypothetical protein
VAGQSRGAGSEQALQQSGHEQALACDAHHQGEEPDIEWCAEEGAGQETLPARHRARPLHVEERVHDRLIEERAGPHREHMHHPQHEG